ncbi:hypothetical protein QBC34DRAFT_462227 [Podospora aff. communis PSN243]|uniref:Uncharacterized protein n=1 Tax=Podospora aff. communis PSN243 TaxID=3040156 RepID=A0AAV9GPY8_9PEZI|nr:hypothetical protein QBC34DRAFT_462227 [Podospora aff. communis PSN243]
MLLPKHLATLLLGAAATLSSLSFAAPTVESGDPSVSVNETENYYGEYHPLAARATKFSSLKGTAASWSKLSTLCAQGKRKRDLSSLEIEISEDIHIDARQLTWPPATPKGFTAVLQGKSDAAFASGNGLWTYGLVTCLGIGVVGTPPSAINEPRHMLHMESTAAVMDAQWDTFEKRVKAAKLTRMRGYMSVPDTTRNTPASWDADMTQLTNAIIVEARTRLQTLTGSAPVVKTRPMSRALAHETPYGTMWIDNRNDVFIEGLKA